MKNMAEKQYDSTYKALGELAGHDVWVYETNIEVWTECVIKTDSIDRADVVKLFDAKRFTVNLNESSDRFYVRNNKLMGAK